MIIENLTDAQTFLDNTTHFRGVHAIATNLLGSVATLIASNGAPNTLRFWWTISGDDGQVVGVAIRVAPFGPGSLILSPMPTEAAEEFACTIAEFDDAFPAVTGPSEVVTTFLNKYKSLGTAGAKRGLKLKKKLLTYAIDDLVTPTNVPGRLRIATIEDLPIATNFLEQFGVETLPDEKNDCELYARTKITQNLLYFWLDDNENIVSMVGNAPFVDTPTGTVGRIGPVYTPPEYRKKGYGSACTAALTKLLQERGARVMLFTDASNPTSNQIYQKLGYKYICDNLDYLMIPPV